MYIATSCPSPALLGSVNGIAQTAISFTRAMGPAGATTLFYLSVENNWAHGYGVFWFFTSFTVVAIYFATFLPS